MTSPSPGDSAGEPCEQLAWDSEHFGFPIARVRASTISAEAAEAIDAWCEQREIRCLYLLADAGDAETARVAARFGYRFVDARLTYVHDAPDPAVSAAAAGQLEIREATEAEVPRLRELAARSYETTRFYFDGNFPRERCDLLYELWLERGVRDPERAIVVPEIEGEAAGYQMLRLPKPGGEAVLELIAIDPKLRGTGLGAAFLRSILSWVQARGATSTTTFLQARNTAAVRAHARAGFACARSETWYHRWYQSPRDR